MLGPMNTTDTVAPGGRPSPPDTPRRHPALDLGEHRAPASGSLDAVVFGVTAVLSVAFIAWGLVDTASLAGSSKAGLDWVVTNTGWFFALVATSFVVFVIWLAAGPFGSIPLGNDGEAPEFRMASWVAMMFSAGMGIGLMFYGAYEPLLHFVTPPPGARGGEAQAVETAMATTLFHWGLHPWAIYAVLGLAIAYSTFRRGRRLTVSAVLTPLLGRRQADGPAGKVVDILAIFATLFGSATSLGLGALQIASGMTIVGWVGTTGNALLVGIIVVLTIAFILSAVSGVAKGIQLLSNTNMVLALVLALFVFVVGPTIFILNLLPTTLGAYAQDLFMMAGRTAVENKTTADWLAGWTIFYWAWWVSWTPFVGMFIARISRGRTIREFVTGVLVVPTVVSLVWFAIFGGAGIKAQQNGADLAGAASAEASLFALLDTMPWATVTSILVMVLVAIFFVSGADAASVVMGSLSQRGDIEPKRWVVVFWGAATGAVAVIMLLVGGADALTGLQQITIVAALPFLVVMVALAVALSKDLMTDPLVIRRRYGADAVERAVVEGVSEHGDDFGLSVEKRDHADDAAAPGPGATV